MNDPYKESTETIKSAVAGKTVDSLTFYLDAIELSFTDGSVLFTGLRQLEDTYDLEVSFKPVGSAEVRLP